MKGFVLGLALKQRQKATWKFNSKERFTFDQLLGLKGKAKHFVGSVSSSWECRCARDPWERIGSHGLSTLKCNT